MIIVDAFGSLSLSPWLRFEVVDDIPHFQGSLSLKSVLPAILPDMSYETLSIQEGNQASFEYLRMLDPLTPPAEREKIKEDLLKYCGHDTLAMVKIREELIKRF